MNTFLRSRFGFVATAALLALLVLLSSHSLLFNNRNLSVPFDCRTPPILEPKNDSVTSQNHNATPSLAKESSHRIENSTQIAVVSMLYGDNAIYERAINTHVRHASRFGNPTYILRTQIIDGIWNKLGYLIHVMFAEMEKGDSGAKWLMWFDADSILLNPSLPHSIFFPPLDFPETHILTAQDQHGFNAGMFLIRCHTWSLSLLASALTLPVHHPEIKLDFEEQGALATMLKKPENVKHVVWTPKLWFNAYDTDGGFQGEALKGCMFMHFPGLENRRWSHMTKWLDLIEGEEGREWDAEYEETAYPKQMKEFWDQMREARRVLGVVRDMNVGNKTAGRLVEVADRLKEFVEGGSLSMERIGEYVKNVTDVLKSENEQHEQSVLSDATAMKELNSNVSTSAEQTIAEGQIDHEY